MGHRLSSHYQSNSSSNLSRCDMSLTFHFFSVFFQCLSVSNLGMQAVVLTWKFVFSRIELNIIQLRSTRGSNFDFEIFKKKKLRLCEQTAPCLHVWLLWRKAGHLTCGVCCACTMSLGQYLGRLPPLTEDL